MKRREDMQVNVAGLRRNIKNLAHNYSNAQVKVREATSNDHWGPSSTLMTEIADLTYNVVAFTDIMQMIWKRLNDHGRNWRHVYKALLLLEYLIKTGSEKVAQQCKENIYAVQTLRDFQYFEEGKDPGLNVREKAKQLVALLKDDERLRNERARALKAKERLAQSACAISSDGTTVATDANRVQSPSHPSRMIWPREWSGSGGSTDTPSKAEYECARPQTAGEEELQLQLALAMSREEADQEEQKRKSDDVRLKLALSQSEKEYRSVAGVSHQSHLVDLLEIDPSSLQQPPLVDPWGVPITAPSTMAPPLPTIQNDPWNVAGPSRMTPPDQWTSVATLPNKDPWKIPEASPSPPTPPPPPVPNLPMKPTDPWSPMGQEGLEEDDFAAITNRNHNNSNNANGRNGTSSVSPDMFDLTTLENGLYPSISAGGSASGSAGGAVSSKQERKTPQSFLGENSALVNLDNLITAPAITSAPLVPQKSGNPNPFGMASSGFAPKKVDYQPKTQGNRDPFQPIQASTASSGGSSGGLPQPLVPQANPFLS